MSERRPAGLLGAAALTSLGVGGIIGSGIFVMVGEAARNMAGPAILVSFLVAALACGCSALCYAEMSSRIPAGGSSFAYARAYLKPFGAWMVGWNLLFQYLLAASSVAQGWSHYFQDLLAALHVPSLPASAAGPLPAGRLDLPALAIVALLTALLRRGLRLSVLVNHLIVAVKLLVILLVLVVGAFYIHPANWTPFAPFGWGGTLRADGPPQGMLAGAAIVFFAYLGFEVATVYSPESDRPARSVPQGILRSLGICTLLYLAMTAVLTGMVPSSRLSVQAPISDAFGQVGLPWVRLVVAAGALAGMTSVVLVILMSLPRVVSALSEAGFLPTRLHETDPRGGPRFATTLGGVVVAALAGLGPMSALQYTVVLATLLTFVTVALLTLHARSQDRAAETSAAPFRAPLGPVVPLLSIAVCVLLIVSLPRESWIGVVAWLGAGVAIHLLRGRTVPNSSARSGD